MIIEQHPLYHIPLDEVFPGLQPLIKFLCFRKSDKKTYDAKEALLEEAGQYQPKVASLKKKRSYVEKLKEKLRLNNNDRKSKEHFTDPFIQYGYGVVAFFNMLKVLILLFSFFSVLVMPIIFMNKYASNTISPYYKLASTTMGNLGSSYSQCIQAPLELDYLIISCQDKYIGEISSFAIMPFHHDNNERICSFQNQTYDDICYDYYGQEVFDQLHKHCVGKSDCKLSNIKSQLKKGKYSPCLANKALVTAQVKCYLHENHLEYNRLVGLISVCVGIFICCIFVLVMYFGYQLNEMDFLLWDLQTVTANDYTVDLLLNEKVMQDYENYCQSHPILDLEPSEHLQNFLRSYIELMLQDYAVKSERHDLITGNKLGVLMMQFDFRQGELLRLMIQRGEAIKSLAFNKKRDIEAKINRYILTHQQDLKNPLRCFVTFEHTDGLNLFIQMISHHHDDAIGKQVKGLQAEPAPIPSNIIWEKRNKTRKEKCLRSFCSLLLIGVLLSVFTLGVFFIMSWGSKGVAPFKKQKCNWVWEQYWNKLTKYSQLAFNESQSYFDNIFSQHVDQEDLNLVSCFCIEEDNSIFYSDFRKRYGLTHDDVYESTNDPFLKHMCSTLKNNFLFANLIYYSSSQTIVFLNFVLRYAIIMIVKFIGYETESKQTSRIMIFVFIVQFINTDLIILFMNADLSQTGWLFFSNFNTGVHPDFTVAWYKDIGLTLINAMVFNIYWPVLEFVAFFCLRTFLRMIDRGLCSCSTWKTRSVTIQKYVDIYSGPEYMIHYKYSAILNITFITFMFGAGMPILFPIALLSFITLYVMERLLVAYSYRQPPMLDETLNRLVIRILMYAPLLYCTVGYWMFNNVQIFDNKVGVQVSGHDHIQTLHTIQAAFRLHLSTPLLLLMIFVIVLQITRRYGQQYIKRWVNLDPQVTFYKPDQVSFVQALNKDQRNWLIQEELKGREKFGIKKISDEVIQKLENTKNSEGIELIGVITYQILDNPIYQKNMQYVPEIVDNRDKYMLDDWALNSLGQSDYVKKNLNIYYLPRKSDQ